MDKDGDILHLLAIKQKNIYLINTPTNAHIFI